MISHVSKGDEYQVDAEGDKWNSFFHSYMKETTSTVPAMPCHAFKQDLPEFRKKKTLAKLHSII